MLSWQFGGSRPELNSKILQMPKISTILQELEGFSFAAALDLNMGYYTIRLDLDAQKKPP
jgi:hypothetical protein